MGQQCRFFYREDFVRVAYVALTRAARVLILAIPDTAAEAREIFMEVGFVTDEARA